MNSTIIFKYQVGQTLGAASYYGKLYRVKVLAQVEYEGEPHYQLDTLIPYNREGDLYGTAEHEDRLGDLFPVVVGDSYPCPEDFLLEHGDLIRDRDYKLFLIERYYDADKEV